MNILIVGASKGLGKYLSDTYCEDGAEVYAIGRNFCETYHPKLHIITADISAECPQDFLKNTPCFDMVLYLASPWESGGITDLNTEKLSLYHQVCVEKFYALMTYLHRTQKVSDTALVITTSSIAGLDNFPINNPFYAYAKHSVRHISRMLQKQLLHLGNIRVTTLTIGGISPDNNPLRIPYADIYQNIQTICNMSPSTYVEEIVVYGKGDFDIEK